MLMRMLDVRAADTVLDVGSGDGYWTRRVASRCSQVVGMEPDDTLRGHAIRFHSVANLDYITGVAEAIPYPDASFTKVFSISCFEHFADQAQAASEIRRVLCPGGVFAMSVDSLLPENSSGEFRQWHAQKHHVTRYFRQSELVDIMSQHGLSCDLSATECIFHSRLAASLRMAFIQRPSVLLPLFPIFYIGSRLGDALFDDIPAQILVVRAQG